MKIRELNIPHAFEVTPKQFHDDRGVFLEWYRFDFLSDAVGHPLELAQANTSISRRGTVRGIHFADVPPSQAKYVTATHGAVMDYVVDVRVGSPTFGEHDSVLLDDQDRRAIYISEGLGHCFVALTESATVSYMVTSVFNIEREHAISPFDESLDLDFMLPKEELLISDKDLAAPNLETAKLSGLLPSWGDCLSYYQSLSEGVR